MKAIRSVLLAVGLFGHASVSAEPGLWQVDKKASSIRFFGTQAGAEFEGAFKSFDAAIRFDANDLAHSSARVTIEVSSVDTANAERDAQLKSEAFFAPNKWPQATFTAHRLRAISTGFSADGALRIRDQTRPVTLVFKVTKAANGEIDLVGGTTIKRLEFGLGQGEWHDTQWVGDAVRIEVKVVARVPPPQPPPLQPKPAKQPSAKADAAMVQAKMGQAKQPHG